MGVTHRLATLILLVALLGGCSAINDDDGAGDAPIGRVDDGPWTVINGVDGYPNVAWKCVGPNGLYTARDPDRSHSRAFTVITNDPNCAGAR